MKKIKYKKSENNLSELLQIKNQTEERAELYFYGDIVADSWQAWADEDQYPEAVKNFLDDAREKNLNIYINSGGGNVFAGIAIYNMLKRHNGFKTVYVDGLAGSIASVIALAGDRIIMPESAFMMIHNPWTTLFGGYNSKELIKMADDLGRVRDGMSSIYRDNLLDGVDIEDIKKMMDDETWLTGTQATQYFNVELTATQTLACTSEYFSIYEKTPNKFKKAENKTITISEKQKQIESTIKEVDFFVTLNRELEEK